jgi:hypothetical protein
VLVDEQRLTRVLQVANRDGKIARHGVQH